MRSHHLKIPVYDVPLRFRPVSTLSYFLLVCHVILRLLCAVVRALHVPGYDHTRLPRLHQLCARATHKRQAAAFLLLDACDGDILLYI